MKHEATLRMHSTDVESMKVLFACLDQSKYWFEYTEDFDDPFSGAHVYNLPCASIGSRIKSTFRLGLRLKLRIYGDILHKKIVKVRKIINQIKQEQS